ncbi:MAG: hypothetical protein K0R98_1230 [Rickettsiaceae bacterium]|nr:hypothetical protein [Rickettsiaceae bacterium]
MASVRKIRIIALTSLLSLGLFIGIGNAMNFISEKERMQRIEKGEFRFEDYRNREEIKSEIEKIISKESSLAFIIDALNKAGALCKQASADECKNAYINAGRKEENAFHKWFSGMSSFDVFKDKNKSIEACYNVIVCSYFEKKENPLFKTSRYIDVFIKHDDNKKVEFIEVTQVISGMP